MSTPQRLLPLGVNFDLSPQYIPSDRAFFLKGVETTWLNNGVNGGNALEIKPSESNFLYCSVDLPAGDNFVNGYLYYSEENTGYVVVYNSNGFHLIYRIIANTSTSEIVYRFPQNFKGITNISADFFSPGRIAMKSLCRYTPDGTKELFKALFLVNKKVDNLQIVIEDSIKTDSFTTPFFTSQDNCCNDIGRIIKSGVPTPMGEINVVPIAVTDADKLKQNTMLFKMFQFRFKDENAWGQVSEHGLISDSYFNNLAGCSKDAAGQPHCVWLETKTPCPDIVRRTIEVRSCDLKTTVGTDGNALSPWKEAFHINLYDHSDSSLRWYERKYDTSNSEFEFFNDGKNIRIKFCNNRECKTIASADVRNENPAPINSGTVSQLGKGLIYGDNENDLAPMLKSDIESIEFSLSETEKCEQKFANIKVYAVVHNLVANQNNPIHKRVGKAVFGGFGHHPLIGNTTFEENVDKPETSLSQAGGHGQYFPDGVIGFRARLAGTDFTAESVQYLWKPSGIEKIGLVDGDANSLEYVKKFVSDVHSGEQWAIQEFNFGLVPQGKYLFRINGHNDTENVDKTSTFYIHTTTINNYNAGFAITQNYQKEIFIDTTNGVDFNSLNSGELAVIADLTQPENGWSPGRFVTRGYIYESKDNAIPIEMADVKNDNFNNIFSSKFTDHNGFYFVSGHHGANYKAQIFGRRKCVFNTILGESGVKEAEGTTLVLPLYAADKVIDYDKEVCNRYFITGTVKECGTNAGIEGVAVIQSKTNPVYTNSKGEFKIISHYGNGRLADKVIFSLGGSCNVLDCNCNPINVVINTSQPPCINCTESVQNVGNFNMKTIVTKGTPHGSRIQIGMTAHDWLGRQTAVQTSEKLFIDFPTEQEQLNSTYPRLKITLPEKFSSDFCSKYKRLTFNYSKNTNYEDFFTWAADEVRFVDSAGNKNESNPSKIQIWWRSLNQYNSLRGFNTNTNWSFLNAQTDTNGNASLGTDGNPVYNAKLGDTVEFIKNVDGKYFPVNTIGNVQYDKAGTYFIVDYEDSLKGLKNGVYFKIKRPYICETQKTFFEYPLPINFCGDDCKPRNDNGEVVTEFYMDMFSSYTLPRQIPVITDVITGGKTTEVKAIKSYPFSFEHHSPSDTWGDHCNNGGRINYVNPYEGKKCDRTQMLLSGALNQANDGAINYLHYFSLEDEFVLDEQGFGKITAILCRDDQQVLVICDLTTFSYRYNDNRAVVTEQGYISVPTNNKFSRPERNPNFNFGCQSNDINTISRKDSIVFFLDSQKKAYVIHDFNSAIDISAGIQSWLVPSIKEVNSNPAMYWHSCIDSRLERVFLTKYLRGQVVNDETENNINLGETLSYDYANKMWRQSHFTPEYFGSMFGDGYDTQFLSFKDGKPYAHHNAINPGDVYLNFFGIQCRPVIGVVTNANGTQEKSFVSTDVYAGIFFFILEKIETSMKQTSKVYRGQWEYGVGCTSAPYLCDTANEDSCNSDKQDILFDGDTMWGKWLKATYIPEPEYKGEFFLLTEIISYFFGR